MATSLGATLDTWLANITQGFGVNGEHGVDVGLAYNTPVYAPTGGTVLGAGYDRQIGGVVSWRSLIHYGGINGPASLYVQHLNTVVVHPGQTIHPGDLLGYSGGQLPWQVPGGGNHPNTSNVSTAPHIEFGINSPPQGSTNFWNALGPNVNPLGFLQALARGNMNVATSNNNTPPPNSGGSNPLSGILFGGIIPPSAVNALQTATDVPGAIAAATAAALTGAANLAKRGAFFLIALVIIIVGVWILVEPQMMQRTEEAVGTAAKAGV